MKNTSLAITFVFVLTTMGTAIWVGFELVTYVSDGDPFDWWSLLAFGISLIIMIGLVMFVKPPEKKYMLPNHQDRKHG